MIFQEYTEEFRDISKGKSKEGIPAGPITLINQRPVGEDLHVCTFVYLFVKIFFSWNDLFFVLDTLLGFHLLEFKFMSFVVTEIKNVI